MSHPNRQYRDSIDKRISSVDEEKTVVASCPEQALERNIQVRVRCARYVGLIVIVSWCYLPDRREIRVEMAMPVAMAVQIDVQGGELRLFSSCGLPVPAGLKKGSILYLD
jgi:hypothetical protein